MLRAPNAAQFVSSISYAVSVSFGRQYTASTRLAWNSSFSADSNLYVPQRAFAYQLTVSESNLAQPN